MADRDEGGEDLAKWLEESGRRRAVRIPLDTAAVPAAEAAPGAPPWRPTARLLFLLILLVLAFLWYFYADVLLTIARLRSVIVFVFTDK